MSNSEPRLADFEARGSGVRSLIGELRRGAFPGAVLLCGGSGMGKTALSRLLAAALLCAAPDPSQRPCGQCRSCKRIQDGTHPDLLTPAETKNKSVGVDQTRGILSALQTYALESDRRVVLLDDADRLTAAAQNSLLKNLEDHPPATHFILTAASESRILSTIRSRVITIRLAPMAADALSAWLASQGIDRAQARESAELSEGSPGQALALNADEADRAMRQLAYETFFALAEEKDIPEICARLKDLKDDFNRYLAVVARELRLCMRHAQDAAVPFRWQAAPPQGVARVLGHVLYAEQQRAANVNDQAVFNVLLQSTLEELQSWPSS